MLSSPNVNRTVKGLSLAVYGLLLRSSRSPSSSPRHQSSNSRRKDGSLMGSTSSNTNSLSVFNCKGPAVPPTLSTIYSLIHCVFRRSSLEPECLVSTLSYLHQYLYNAGPEDPIMSTSDLYDSQLFNKQNWYRVLLILLILSSKMWDDISCTNVSFSIITKSIKIGRGSPPPNRSTSMGLGRTIGGSGSSSGSQNPWYLPVTEINEMERIMLRRLKWNLFLDANEYRKRYYEMKRLWMNAEIVVEKPVYLEPGEACTESGGVECVKRMEWDVVKELGIEERYGPKYIFRCFEPTEADLVSGKHLGSVTESSLNPVASGIGIGNCGAAVATALRGKDGVALEQAPPADRRMIKALTTRGNGGGMRSSGTGLAFGETSGMSKRENETISVTRLGSYGIGGHGRDENTTLAESGSGIGGSHR